MSDPNSLHLITDDHWDPMGCFSEGAPLRALGLKMLGCVMIHDSPGYSKSHVDIVG